MSDKIYTKLGSVTLAEFREQLKADSIFNSLSETQQNGFVNAAKEKLNELLNDLGYDDYAFDANGDASLVLNPTTGGLLALFDQYGQLKFPDYDGSGDNVTFTSVSSGLTLSVQVGLSLASHGGLAAYTVGLVEEVLDGDTEIFPSIPNIAEIVPIDSRSFLVIASLTHEAFSVFIRNWKES